MEKVFLKMISKRKWHERLKTGKGLAEEGRKESRKEGREGRREGGGKERRKEERKFATKSRTYLRNLFAV